MAFVFKADRQTVVPETEGARNSALGPGAYAVEKPQSKQFGCRPSFLTSTGRNGKAAQPKMRHSADMNAHNTSGMSFFMKGNKKAQAQL